MSWTKQPDGWSKIFYALRDASRMLSEEHANCIIDEWRYQIAAAMAQVDKSILMFKDIAKPPAIQPVPEESRP